LNGNMQELTNISIGLNQVSFNIKLAPSIMQLQA
jgi:hypothetical protein